MELLKLCQFFRNPLQYIRYNISMIKKCLRVTTRTEAAATVVDYH